MEPSLNLDLGALQNLLNSLTSQSQPTQEVTQSDSRLQDLNHLQSYEPSSQLPSCYSHQALNYSYPSYLPPQPSIPALLESLQSSPGALSPLTPQFSRPTLPPPTHSQSGDIFALLNALQPVHTSQYFPHPPHHPTTPGSAGSRLPEPLSLLHSSGRSRDETDDHGSQASHVSKKLKLGSPPLTPTSARDGTPDLLSGTSSNLAEGPPSRPLSLAKDEDGSISHDQTCLDSTDSPPIINQVHQNFPQALISPTHAISPLSPLNQDISLMKFAQALPILSTLVENESFLDAFQEVSFLLFFSLFFFWHLYNKNKCDR